MNHKYILSLLSAVSVLAFGIAFWSSVDQRSKELFFGFAGTVATGSFALMTPRGRNDDADDR